MAFESINMLRIQREWSDERYCRYLPRLWNPQAKMSITKFFIGLGNRVLKSRIQLDRAFIDKFAEGGVAKLLNTAAHAAQPEGVTCVDFLGDIDFAKKAMNMWNPKALPSDNYIVETLYHRFSSAEMLKLMRTAKRRGDNIALEDLHEYALIADDYDRIERRTDTTKILKFDTTSGSDWSHPDTRIRAIVHELSYTDNDMDECFEDMLLSLAAVESICMYHGTPSVRAVAKVMDKIERAPHVGIFSPEEVVEKGAVCNGPLKHKCKPSHICAWFALKGSCTLKGKCKHKHVVRREKLCSCLLYTSPSPRD